ncbi:hypothetical protein [Deinococcus yavapaiensis]|uniref:CARD domain-containing protein n=1 Tax=Deinococcus yavapaiensis KR-236 TaxID=694435 RepID=A0A318SGR1_9DEIO|nr:hypothetical protein [Deinococcus yavapaiensis]PYE56295.1 hypothetical protein DES52_10199 [Deinococcus yavapaiensis KR-236]
MNETLGQQAVAANASMKKLLDLLVAKGVLSKEEAFSVLAEGADSAQDRLDEIQTEAGVQG